MCVPIVETTAPEEFEPVYSYYKLSHETTHLSKDGTTNSQKLIIKKIYVPVSVRWHQKYLGYKLLFSAINCNKKFPNAHSKENICTGISSVVSEIYRLQVVVFRHKLLHDTKPLLRGNIRVVLPYAISPDKQNDFKRLPCSSGVSPNCGTLVPCMK